MDEKSSEFSEFMESDNSLNPEFGDNLNNKDASCQQEWFLKHY